MKYPFYRYPVQKLFTGCSLGNYYLFARFDPETNLKGIWCADDNQFYAGDWTTEILADDTMLTASTTEFYPESQLTLYSRDGISIAKRVFLPSFFEEEADAHQDEMHSLVYLFHVKNESTKKIKIRFRHTIVLPAAETPFFTKQPPPDEMKKRFRLTLLDNACEITTQGSEHESRIFFSPGGWKVTGHDNQTLAFDNELNLDAGDEDTVQLILAISHHGIGQARRTLQRVVNSPYLLEMTIMNFRELLGRSSVMTPDPVINNALQWSKVNIVRVQHRYTIGEAFTNDPPQDIVVIRDLAWYVLGSDYLTPAFSRHLLELGARFGFHDGGKLTEYLHANEPAPEKHDYNLNINDDTPLFVYALHHHASVAGEEECWRLYYPLMRQAAEWIISQMKDGLVHCTAQGVMLRGICGWRNMIDHYTLSGAVTEVNAECYHALACTAETASRLGLDDDAQRYSSQAERLKFSINSKLVSHTTDLYLLNLDLQGNPYHDVTGDLIFPVMFHLAEKPMRERILRRLTAPDIWTEFGSRTVSKQEKSYNPDAGYQLMGGVWHNLTAWTAFCIRRENPALLVEGMKNIYRLPEIQNPKEYQNVVPGEFPERLHGDTFVSRGMALSPWMPPTYLWLGIEGLLGVQPLSDIPEISPAIPNDWHWIAVKNLIWKNSSITAFLFDEILYTDFPVTSLYPVKTGVALETASEDENIFSTCLKVDNELLLFAASDKNVKGTVHIRTTTGIIDRNIILKAGAALLERIPVSRTVTRPLGKEA